MEHKYAAADGTEAPPPSMEEIKKHLCEDCEKSVLTVCSSACVLCGRALESNKSSPLQNSDAGDGDDLIDIGLLLKPMNTSPSSEPIREGKAKEKAAEEEDQITAVQLPTSEIDGEKEAEMKYKCKICERSFKTRHALAGHMGSHSRKTKIRESSVLKMAAAFAASPAAAAAILAIGSDHNTSPEENDKEDMHRPNSSC